MIERLVGVRVAVQLGAVLGAVLYVRGEHVAQFVDDLLGAERSQKIADEDEHGARQADVCLTIIRSMTHWYQSRNDDYVSPIVKGMSRYKADDHKRARTLGDEELRALWTCANGTFGAFVKVLLLTAQRKDKVAQMRWDDIVDGEWRISHRTA